VKLSPQECEAALVDLDGLGRPTGLFKAQHQTAVQCLRQRFTLDSRAIQIDSIFDQRVLFEERADIVSTRSSRAR